MFRNLLAVIAASRMVRMRAPIAGDIPIQGISIAEKTLITLPLNPDTAVDGEQSMFFNNREGHVLVKPLPRTNPRERKFEVLRNFRTLPKPQDRVWLSGWLGETPTDFGINDFSEVSLPNRTLAWLIPGGESWVINVHGRKAARAETLRVAPIFQKLRFTQLVISHVTDPKPSGLGTRTSNLGVTEWRQVAEAVEYARTHGAKQIVLYGWSLGCLLIGEYLRNSDNAEDVVRVIFDSPLLDYPSTVRLQAINAGFPAAFADLVLHKLKTSWILKALGLQKKSFPDLIHSLGRPVLVFYSQLDGYVSMNRIEDFVTLNEVALEHFVGGRHCRLYNQDPTRYTKAIEKFLSN